MRVVVLLFLLISLLFSKDIELDNLLTKYGQSQELYLKTKNESAGFVIVFSRSDLDRMQAYTLNDVLKTLRMYTLQTSNIGSTTLVKSGGTQLSNTAVKIYINSQELNSATLGNPLAQYGKMGLYFIDHIEVYQAGNSVIFGNEPGSLIIKLYTKKPSRENGTYAQISMDSRSSLNIRALDAHTFGDYSYLANIDISKNNYKEYNTNSSELSRDGVRGQFYFKLSKDNSYDIEVGATDEKYDLFSGIGLSPTDGEIHNKNIYIQMSKYFDDNLKVILKASSESLSAYNEDSSGFLLFDGTTSNLLDAKIGTYVYSAIAEKKFILNNNELFIGAQIKSKEFHVDNLQSNGIDKYIDPAPTKINIYMAYIEDMYNINKNNLITFSAKLDYYRDNFSKSSPEHILRLGYVSIIDDSLTFKFFAMKSYMYPTFRQTTFAHTYNTNPNLNSSKSVTSTAEAIYRTNDNTFTIGGGSSEVDDAIIFNMAQRKYINYDQKVDFQRVYVRVEHDFDLNNKVTLEYFKAYQKNFFSPGSGALIQLFNKIGKLDIYNELVYRSKYTSYDGIKMPEGYNYTVGVIYPVDKNLDIKLKGENIFDRASEVPINGIDVPSMEPRAILTLEYTF